MIRRPAFSATALLTLAMLHVKTFETRRVVPVALVFLSVSLAVVLVPLTSAYEEPAKAPDLTDYLSMYKVVYVNIWDNNKAIESDKKELEDKPDLTKTQISEIKKRIGEKTLENLVANSRYTNYSTYDNIRSQLGLLW
ncbi:MAG: hypothetical protein D9C04_04090 [Nitrosopumilus sp. B06]|nr:MAG: hypothetical protein D9C04_04090 [Nitrosopumilus sp. B06]